jgi:hypothetical protein
MSNPPPALLPELAETAARGALAVIYQEVRHYSAVPYVSSLQRCLATMPGVLEWAWAAVRPGMVSGLIPQTGWRLAETVRIAPLPPVTAALRDDWGIDAAALAAIRAIAANFLRVSPVNLMTGACLRLLLTGAEAKGGALPADWTPPAMLPAMPGNVDPLALPEAQRAVLLRFATPLDGIPFVPALYRQLAHWPGLLAWLADALVPRLAAAETNGARDAFRAAAMAEAADIVARLPPLPPGAPLDAATTRRVLAAIDRYATTSPEMTMFGRLLLDCLPAA